MLALGQAISKALLSTFPVLLRVITGAIVRASFVRVNVADVKRREKEDQPQALASKRQLLFCLALGNLHKLRGSNHKDLRQAS